MNVLANYLLFGLIGIIGGRILFAAYQAERGEPYSRLKHLLVGIMLALVGSAAELGAFERTDVHGGFVLFMVMIAAAFFTVGISSKQSGKAR